MKKRSQTKHRTAQQRQQQQQRPTKEQTKAKAQSPRFLTAVSIFAASVVACAAQDGDLKDENTNYAATATNVSETVSPRAMAPMPTCKMVLDGPGIAAYCGNANATIYEADNACWCSGGGDGGVDICGEEGCKNPNPACACGAGKMCNAVGTCEACVPKTCSDFPGQCSNGAPAPPGPGLVEAGAGEGGADAATTTTTTPSGPAIADGCGGTLTCPCANAGDVCTNGGVCAPPACTATNQPKGPQGTSFRPPGLNLEYEVPKGMSAFLCKLPTAMGLPTLSDKAKIKVDVAGGWDSTGLPICLSKDTFDIKIAGEAELCGWIFGLKGSYNDSTETLYCPYCDLADNTNKCTSDWGRQTGSSRLRVTGEFGPKVEKSAADLVNWLFEAMKYKKTGTGEEVYVLKQLPFYGRMMSFIQNNKKSIDDLAKFKAEAKVSANVTRSKDTTKRGTAKCSAALNCDDTAMTVGPGIGAGVSLEINLPPKGTGIGRLVGDFFSFNCEVKLAANGNIQYGIKLRDGECGAKNCLTVNAFGNVGGIVRVGARMRGVMKVRASFDMTCIGQVGFEACDDLSIGPTTPEAKCKMNSFISTE